MKINQSTILITGAAGGIGQALVKQLDLMQAKHLILVDYQQQALEQLAQNLQSSYQIIGTDLSTMAGRLKVNTELGDSKAVDILINGAGILYFQAFTKETDDTINRLYQINVIAPMVLTQMLLPSMLTRQQGHIVNIGSIIASIGFAYFTSYASSKSAIHGFSQSLRRELHNTPIKVSYIAPRTTQTAINSEKTYQMYQEMNTKVDTVDWVVKQIIQAIESNKKEVFLGWPERFFVKLNALFPSLVDLGLASSHSIMSKYVNKES